MASELLKRFIAYYEAYFSKFPADTELAIGVWERVVRQIPPHRVESVVARVAEQQGDRYKPKVGSFERIWRWMQTEEKHALKENEVENWGRSLSPVERWMASVRYNSLVELQRIGSRGVERLCERVGTRMAYHPDPPDGEAREIESPILVAGYVCKAREMNRSWAKVEPLLGPGEEPGQPREMEWFERTREAGLLDDTLFRQIAGSEIEPSPVGAIVEEKPGLPPELFSQDGPADDEIPF